MPMSLLVILDFSFSLEERNVEHFQHPLPLNGERYADVPVHLMVQLLGGSLCLRTSKHF